MADKTPRLDLMAADESLMQGFKLSLPPTPRFHGASAGQGFEYAPWPTLIRTITEKKRKFPVKKHHPPSSPSDENFSIREC